MNTFIQMLIFKDWGIVGNVAISEQGCPDLENHSSTCVRGSSAPTSLMSHWIRRVEAEKPVKCAGQRSTPDECVQTLK